MKEKKYDLITLGRSSIDLYSQSIGAEFVDIAGFNAFVGGSPLNIAVGVRRLGAQTALLTGIGNDKVGDFVLNFLEKDDCRQMFLWQLPRKNFPLAECRGATSLWITGSILIAIFLIFIRLMDHWFLLKPA